MVQNIWFFYALGAAVMWGLGYLFGEKTMGQGVSVTALMLFSYVVCAPVFLVLSYANKTLKYSFDTLVSNKAALLYFVVMVVAVTIGNVFIFKSIVMKNATYANIVEISYPFFTILFTWVLFREFHLNPATLLGAGMIFGGVMLIYLKS